MGVAVALIHRVDRAPILRYYYKVGAGETFGETLTFQSLKAAGPNYPQRLLLIADWGLSHNSAHLLLSQIRSCTPVSGSGSSTSKSFLLHGIAHRGCWSLLTEASIATVHASTVFTRQSWPLVACQLAWPFLMMTPDDCQSA